VLFARTTVGEVDGLMIRDINRNINGQLDGNMIRDREGKRVGQVEGDTLTAIGGAAFFFLFRNGTNGLML
jgi:protein gp37